MASPIIVVLGWGSLIPKPAHRDDAPLATTGVRPHVVDAGGSWRTDGPDLPLQLARMATLPGTNAPYVSWVITPGASRSPALYAPLELPAHVEPDLDRALHVAARALAVREGIDDTHIGRWPAARPHAEAEAIAAWARARDLGGVVWTALAPEWNGERRAPGEAELLAYVRELVARGEAAGAEEYIRTTPAQTTSPLRAAVERELGWLPR